MSQRADLAMEAMMVMARWKASKQPAECPAPVDQAARRSRQLVNRHALMAAGVAAVPVPGLDFLADVAVLLKLIPQINRQFGLSAEQVAQLSPDRQVMAYQAISAAGSLLIGRLVTRDLVLQVLRTVGVRLSAQQVTKYLPLAGQVASAALTFSSLKYVCEQHIRQCIAVSEKLMQLPAPKSGF